MSDVDTNIAGYLVLVLRTILVMTLCSQYLRGVAVPVPRLQGRGLSVVRVKVSASKSCIRIASDGS